MRQRLPQLMDSRMIQLETGLPESMVRRIMRRCTIYHIDGFRKAFVRRDELLAKLRTDPAPPEQA